MRNEWERPKREVTGPQYRWFLHNHPRRPHFKRYIERCYHPPLHIVYDHGRYLEKGVAKISYQVANRMISRETGMMRYWIFDDDEWTKVMAEKEVRPRITINPEVRFGKPCIKGTRIAVIDIMQLLRGGMTRAEIISDYQPYVTDEDIQACVDFGLKEP